MARRPRHYLRHDSPGRRTGPWLLDGARTRNCSWPASSTVLVWTSSRPAFPIASDADAASVRLVATEVRRPIIAALARCATADIERAGEVLKPAARARSTRFLATSDLHLDAQAAHHPAKSVSSGDPGVSPWRGGYTDDVQFSAEDATRSDFDFLCRVVEGVIDAGATTINLPDTVGYSTPDEIGDFFVRILQCVPECRPRPSSAPTTMTTSASPSPIRWPPSAPESRQIECTVNGIGERAGNAALEEIVMAFKVRSDRLPYTTGIVTEELFAFQSAPDGADRSGRAAEQGHRRAERVCTRSGHPPGWHVEGSADIRDHEARGCRSAVEHDGARQAFGASCPASAVRAARLHPRKAHAGSCLPAR